VFVISKFNGIEIYFKTEKYREYFQKVLEGKRSTAYETEVWHAVIYLTLMP